MTDPTTDMLNRIRNANAVSKETVSIPFSILKFRIAKILLDKGFISEVEKKGRGIDKKIEIKLKYKDNIPVITGIKRISKPGQRIYLSSKEIRKVRGGHGISVISTPKGVISGEDAKRQNVGGEIIFEIY